MLVPRFYVYKVHMSAREALKVLKSDGWFEVGQRGSHLYLKHATKPGKVAVPRHGSADLSPTVLNGIKAVSGLDLRRSK